MSTSLRVSDGAEEAVHLANSILLETERPWNQSKEFLLKSHLTPGFTVQYQSVPGV